MDNQLNKLQIKAEVLTVLSKLQTNIDSANVDAIIKTLTEQEDKKAILDVLIKELMKSNEQKTILICFLLLKLCEDKEVETSLWEVLKNPSVSDGVKTIVLNVLKDMGNKVEYEKLGEFFENPNDVIDADTQNLLKVAIINPEAQIDFLDFLSSLSALDKKLLVQSLGDDYSSDNLANILNPLVLYNPNSELGKIAIEILGSTKSQLALHTLLEVLDFEEDEETVSLVKKSLSTLKIAGVREDNALEFYKSLLSSKPHSAYTSYPDGHGNQALIFAREREDETIQMTALVVNDTLGIVDCFGFNQISAAEYSRITERFYNGSDHVYINPHFAKTMLNNAERLTRKVEGKLSYEYICWKNLFSDIESEPVPIELTLRMEFKQDKLSEESLNKIYNMDFIQRWFLDTEYSPEFKIIVEDLNSRMASNFFQFDLDEIVEANLEKIFSSKEKNLLDKRILMGAYLKFLEGSKTEAQDLYSLYFDEDKKSELSKNIIRKSLYEYYVSMKFKYKEEHKMTNIFAMRNKPKPQEVSQKQIDLMISLIERLWVK